MKPWIKAVLLALAGAVAALTADHTAAHKISAQVVKVVPFIPDAPPSPADNAKPSP